MYRKILTRGKELDNGDECHVTGLVKIDKDTVIMARVTEYHQGSQMCVSAPTRGYRNQWQAANTPTPPRGQE